MPKAKLSLETPPKMPEFYMWLFSAKSLSEGNVDCPKIPILADVLLLSIELRL